MLPTKLLLVTCSPSVETSVTRKMAHILVQRYRHKVGDRLDVVERDLARDPLPHVDDEMLRAWRTPRTARDDRQRALALASEQAIRELRDAEVVVVASPMWNFAVPSSLKAWLDHVVREDEGVGIADGEAFIRRSTKLYLLTSSGRVYSKGPLGAFDFQVPYLKAIFKFMGFQSIKVIRAEATHASPQRATEQALVEIVRMNL